MSLRPRRPSEQGRSAATHTLARTVGIVIVAGNAACVHSARRPVPVMPPMQHATATQTPRNTALPAGWVWFDALAFRLAAPSNVTQHPAQGVDSFIGTFVTHGLRVSFDVGLHCGDPDDPGWRGPHATEYAARDVRVSGHGARASVWRSAGGYNAALRVRGLDAQGTGLLVHAVTDDAGHQQLAVQILETVTLDPVPGARPYVRDTTPEELRALRDAERMEPGADRVAAYGRAAAGLLRRAESLPDGIERAEWLLYAAIARERAGSCASARPTRTAAAALAASLLDTHTDHATEVHARLRGVWATATMQQARCDEDALDLEAAVTTFRRLIDELRGETSSNLTDIVHDASVSRATLLEQMERWSDARQAWLDALAYTDGSERLEARRRAAHCALQEGHIALAERELREVILPNQPIDDGIVARVLADRVEALARLGRRSEARSLYDDLVHRVASAARARSAEMQTRVWQLQRLLATGRMPAASARPPSIGEAGPSLAPP